MEEFDSRDRALVWRTVGGKHRYLLRDAMMLVPDQIAAFRQAAIDCLTLRPDLSLDAMEVEHALLASRLERFGDCRDAVDIWRQLGIADAEGLPLLEAEAFIKATHDKRA